MFWEILCDVSSAERMGIKFQPREAEVVFGSVFTFIMTFQGLMC